MTTASNSAKPAARGEPWKLRLFVSGAGAVTEQIRSNLRQICDAHLEDYQLDTIDICTNPDLADTHNIVVVPTLIRLSPEPERRILGDLSLTRKVLLGLGISAAQGG